MMKKSTTQCSASKLAHQDSNLEMTESESVALPFGDGPLFSQQMVSYTIPSGMSIGFFIFYAKISTLPSTVA